MKVIPAPLTTEEQEAVVQSNCLPVEQRWLLVFESELEAQDFIEYLRRQMYNEDGSLKTE